MLTLSQIFDRIVDTNRLRVILWLLVQLSLAGKLTAGQQVRKCKVRFLIEIGSLAKSAINAENARQTLASVTLQPSCLEE